MSIPIRGLAIFRPLQLGRLFSQTNRTLSFVLRRENTSLRFTNASYAFPLSPPSEIQPEQTEASHAGFLEEATEEYGHLENIESLSDSAVQSSADQAAEVILRLIAKGEIDKALSARDEFLKHGFEIVQNRAFASAAIEELSNTDPEVRSRRFIAWWSLTPLRECPGQLAVACAKLMDHPFDIPLIMDFCVLCAKSGHIREVVRSRLFPHIFRHGHPNATTAFLVKLEHEAKKHYQDADPKTWMSMRNLAIRMHLLAGRKEIAMEMYKGVVTKGYAIEPQTLELLEANKSSKLLSADFISTKSLQSDGPRDRHRPVSKLAQELRILRRIITSRSPPPHFERFLAEFIDAYELLGRKSRAILRLRHKVFKDATLAVRTRWIAGEMMAYSMKNRAVAVIRTFVNYYLADNILAAEVTRVSKHWRERNRSRRKKQLDWRLSQKPIKVDWKLWPSNASVSLAWKAVLQLSQKRDLRRLYSLFLKLVESAKMAPQQLAVGLSTTSDVAVADKQYYDASSHAVCVSPAVFPDPYYFHHFVVAVSTRCAPREGALIIRDMQRLRFKPAMETWGALAGAYARSGDLKRVLRILDHLESQTPPVRGQTAENDLQDPKTDEQRRSKSLVATYNSVLRGFTEAAMYPEARVIQRRMQEHGFLSEAPLRKDRMDKRTRSILHRLSRYEKGLYDRFLYRPKRKTVTVNGRLLVIDKKRADWLREEEI